MKMFFCFWLWHVTLSLESPAGMPAALSLLCLSRCCVCVHAGTPGGPLRCGWTSINSTTTLRGRPPRAKPSAGLSVILSLSSRHTAQTAAHIQLIDASSQSFYCLSQISCFIHVHSCHVCHANYCGNRASKQDLFISPCFYMCTFFKDICV